MKPHPTVARPPHIHQGTEDKDRAVVGSACGYGKTKEGQFMTQKQAQDKGYGAAYNEPCQ